MPRVFHSAALLPNPRHMSTHNTRCSPLPPLPVAACCCLQVFMDGISVNGKPLSDLSGLQSTAIDASKALKALPQLLNMTMMGMDVAKISAMAEKLNIKLPTLTNEMSSSIDELKKLPTLLTVSDGLRHMCGWMHAPSPCMQCRCAGPG